MSVVDEAIQDGVAEGWVADNVVPMFNRDLTGDDGGGVTVAIIEDLQKVAPFGRIENRKTAVPVGNLIRLASEAESRNVSIL